MNVFMLAAGLGTRLRPLTEKYPKPCVPFLNVPLGLYHFRFLNDLPISRFVVNTFHLPKQVEALYLSQPYYKKPILFSSESGEILGSAGGLKKASTLFSDDECILMLNADEIFFDINADFLKNAYDQHRSEKNMATLVVMQHPEAGKKFGAIWCEEGRVVHIGKAAANERQKPLHYIGIIFLHKKVLELIPDNKETNIFYDILINELHHKKVGVHQVSCRWYETGNAADYFNATEDQLSKLDEPTLNFINLYDPSTLKSTTESMSLISNSLNKEINISGFCVAAKTTNPNSFKNPGLIEDSVFFENEILNKKYFTASVT